MVGSLMTSAVSIEIKKLTAWRSVYCLKVLKGNDVDVPFIQCNVDGEMYYLTVGSPSGQRKIELNVLSCIFTNL